MCPPTKVPLKEPSCLVFRMILLKASTTKINKRGASGHPCHRILPSLKKGGVHLLIKIAKDMEGIWRNPIHHL